MRSFCVKMGLALQYAWLTRWPFVLIIGAFLVLILVIGGFDLGRGAAPFVRFDEWWAKSAEPLFAALTLSVAIAIWFGEVYQGWVASLPKRLDVLFLFNGQPLMECQKAGLSGESDIRALGQQIGQQMSGLAQLVFAAPKVTTKLRGVAVDGAFLDYRVEFVLGALPGPRPGKTASIEPNNTDEATVRENKGVAQSKPWAEFENVRMFFDCLRKEKRCLCWSEPFDAIQFTEPEEKLAEPNEGTQKLEAIEEAEIAQKLQKFVVHLVEPHKGVKTVACAEVAARWCD